MRRAIEFYSEGFKLVGDIYSPEDLRAGERRQSYFATAIPVLRTYIYPTMPDPLIGKATWP